jgi:hypothetical protein
MDGIATSLVMLALRRDPSRAPVDALKSKAKQMFRH